MSKNPETAGVLPAHELNPRNITPEQLARLDKSLEAYGDLSGVIYNRRTKKQLGGHQRNKLIEPDAPIECKYFDKKDAQGTVGMGHILSKKYGRLVYREVDWPKEIELAAMVAANAHGGDWDESLLRQTLLLVSESEKVDDQTIGLSSEFLEKLFKEEELDLNVQQQEKKALERPLDAKEINNLPSQTAMLQLFYTQSTRPQILLECKALQTVWGTSNITDTVRRAIKEAYDKLKADEKPVSVEFEGAGNPETTV